MKIRAAGSQAGSAMAAMLIGVLVCGAISAAVLTTNSGRSRQAHQEVASERAFQLAEAGSDWAVAQLRIRNGVVPTSVFNRTITGAGRFKVQYVQGTDNHRDDDGDGVVDNAGENVYAQIVSTGTAGEESRSIQIIMRKAIEIPTFDAAVQINVEAPVLDLSGNAFTIDGREHLIDGTLDTSRPGKYGITSPAPVAVLAAQVPTARADRVMGVGGLPSLGTTPAIDLNRLVEQARTAASVLIEPGTHTNLALGSPVAGSTVVAYSSGDIHLTGNDVGAGVLVVDGDLTISGAFRWVGIVLVRGRVRMVGGGGSKRIIGALAAGEEAEASTSTTSVDVTGTVDLWFSADAVTLASEAFAIMSIMSWREVANPAP